MGEESKINAIIFCNSLIVYLCICIMNTIIRESLFFFLFLIGVIPFLMIDSWVGGTIAFLTHSLVVFALGQKVRKVPVQTVYCRKGKRLVQHPPPIHSTIQVDRPMDNKNLSKNEPADRPLTLVHPPVPSALPQAKKPVDSILSVMTQGLTPQLDLTPPI